MSNEQHTSKMAWAVPEVEAVREGVHRLPLPLPNDALTAVNVYALDTGEGLLLIDGGWNVPEGREQLEQMLGTIGFELGDIAEILVTHMHRDHYTLASALQEQLGCRVRLGAGEAQNIEVVQRNPNDFRRHASLLEEAGADELVRHWSEWITSQPDSSSSWRSPDSWIEDGAMFERGRVRLRAVATPGHTRGHVVFVDEDRGLLFSGDHILPTITPSVGFEPVRDRLALGAYLDSLRLILALPDLAIMPAHGPAGMSSRDRAAALLSHHDDRLAATLAQVDDGETAFKVASDLTWTRREHRHSDLEPYNRALAVMETEYHLGLLEHRGLVRSGLEAGVRRYWRTDSAAPR